jgi:transposase
MRKAIPSITEHAAGLKQRLRREQDSHKQLRLQMLYLLASQQTHERQEAAQLLGVHRNTIGGWLAIYVAGGLAALLATHAPPRQTRLARVRRADQPRTGAPPPRPRVL